MERGHLAVGLADVGPRTIHLEADFSAGSFSGRIDALSVKVRGSPAILALPEGNSIDIASAPIGEAQTVAEWIGIDRNEDATPREAIRGFTER